MSQLWVSLGRGRQCARTHGSDAQKVIHSRRRSLRLPHRTHKHTGRPLRAAARLAGVHWPARVWADGVGILVHHGLAGHPACRDTRISTRWAGQALAAAASPAAAQRPQSGAAATRAVAAAPAAGSCRRAAPVLDLSSHGHERLLNIGGVLGAGLQEGDADLVGKGLHPTRQHLHCTDGIDGTVNLCTSTDAHAWQTACEHPSGPPLLSGSRPPSWP